MSSTQRRDLGVRIVEGEMLGSSYVAAELFADIDDAEVEQTELSGLAERIVEFLATRGRPRAKV